MTGVKWLADMAESAREPLGGDNPFRQWETFVSESIASTLSLAGTTRESLYEIGFQSLYGWGLPSEDER